MTLSARTENSAVAYSTSNNALIDFFSKAGSMIDKKRRTVEQYDVLQLFDPAWQLDNVRAMKLALWLRDCRGGAGNRSGFRKVLAWLAVHQTGWAEVNMAQVPGVGRWDDLLAFMGTPCEKQALEMWVTAVKDGNGLAAKWVPRKNKEVFNKMRKIAGMSPKAFRQLVVKHTKVVETLMCEGKFDEIVYNHVPSVAMARYKRAFNRHDEARFNEWTARLATGEADENGEVAKVHADVLFPHDIVRMLVAEGYINHNSWYFDREEAKEGTCPLADAQFAALPDYMEGADARIMTLCDFSGSMNMEKLSNNITAMDVSMALGLYCSDRIGEDNPFYRSYIPFSSQARFRNWNGKTFTEECQAISKDESYAGSTNVADAVELILRAGKSFRATADEMPNMLLIISDMQFDSGSSTDKTVIEKALDRWVEAGYNKPTVVYWDTSGRANTQAESTTDNVALVSGFSPSILKAILQADDFSPMAVMDKALEKYDVVVPEAA
jgi:hypothetical protein